MIEKIAHAESVDKNDFMKKVAEIIEDHQKNGLAVEVQYQTTVVTDEISAVVYSALIIGRKEKNYGNTQL